MTFLLADSRVQPELLRLPYLSIDYSGLTPDRQQNPQIGNHSTKSAS
jgi:hypothetical protein